MTSLSCQYGQSCFIDHWTSQFSDFRLCQCVSLCDVCYSQTVCPHCAGHMFWWMVKNMMTNETYDARAAGLHNPAVQVETPQKCMSRIIPNNRMLVAHIHGMPPSIRYALSSKVARMMRQQNVNQSGSNMQSSHTLRATLPVLLITSRCSQTPLELGKVVSDCARAISGALDSTRSYGGTIRILRDLTYRIVKFWSSGDLCADLQETSRAAKTAALHCGRLRAVLSEQWFVHNHKAFYLIILVFVTVTRFAASTYGMHYWSVSKYVHLVDLATDGSRAYSEEHMSTPIEKRRNRVRRYDTTQCGRSSHCADPRNLG